jgi:hypothetical protein
MNLSASQHNLREIAKQLILLEEHLLVSGRYCMECISKHLLAVEGLADEAQCLDGDSSRCNMAKQLGGWARRWAELISMGTHPQAVGQEVRHVRKRLVPSVFAPDAAYARRNSAQLVSYSGYEHLMPDRRAAWILVAAAVGVGVWYMERRRGQHGGVQ